MNRFKIGDVVTAKDPNRRTYGHVGIVSIAEPWGDVAVKFPHLVAPAYFFHANLKPADQKVGSLSRKTLRSSFEEEQKYIVIFYACDLDGGFSDEIVEGNIGDANVEEAIFNELQDAYDEALFFDTKVDFDEWVQEITQEYSLVFGFVNNKPFRFVSRPTFEVAGL